MSSSEQPALPIENQGMEEEPDIVGYQDRASSSSADVHDNDTEKAIQPKQPGNDVPDGGIVAWLVVLGAWCASFCTFGWLNSTTGSYRTKAEALCCTLTEARHLSLPGVLSD